ncbi:MAG: hypothetical protein WAM82_01160 [Thermoanaerobaculia bacterium]
MAFLFKMTFTGLCAFVPSDPLGSGTVLLVNSQGSADDLNFHGPLDQQHVPRMRLQSTTPSLLGKVLSYSVVAPATIEPNTLQLIDATFPPPLPEQPAAGTAQERGVFWIANLAEIDGGNVDDSCFGMLPNPRVAARVKLSAGFLTTSRMVEKPAGDDIVWNFKKSSSSATPTLIRAMAAEFSLTALVNGDAININIFEPATGMTSSQTLQPVGGEVVVEIENSCFRPDDGGALEDFVFFYRLSRVRTTIQLPYRTEGGDLSDTLCPPARFPAHPMA